MWLSIDVTCGYGGDRRLDFCWIQTSQVPEEITLQRLQVLQHGPLFGFVQVVGKQVPASILAEHARIEKSAASFGGGGCFWQPLKLGYFQPDTLAVVAVFGALPDDGAAGRCTD